MYSFNHDIFSFPGIFAVWKLLDELSAKKVSAKNSRIVMERRVLLIGIFLLRLLLLRRLQYKGSESDILSISTTKEGTHHMTYIHLGTYILLQFVHTLRISQFSTLSV